MMKNVEKTPPPPSSPLRLTTGTSGARSPLGGWGCTGSQSVSYGACSHPGLCAPISAIALQLNDLAWSWVQPDNCIMWRSSVALDRLSVPVAAVISLPAPPLLSLLTTGSGEDVTDPTAPSHPSSKKSHGDTIEAPCGPQHG